MKKNLLLGLLLTASIGFAQEDLLINGSFDELNHKPDLPDDPAEVCRCAYWLNKDLGDQGESSGWSSNTIFGIKFDNAEPDIIYQEVAVEANSNYTFTYSYRISDLAAGADLTLERMEARILKGSGYDAGYIPEYHSLDVVAAQSGYGYTDIVDVENADNNIDVATFVYPGDDDLRVETITFDTADETSIAVFLRGIGGPAGTTTDDWTASEVESRVTALSLVKNEATASRDDVFASKFSIYPNPANGVVTINNADVELASLQLVNTLGRTVYTSKVTSTLDVSSIPTGVYFLNLKATDGASATKKLIIE